MKKDGFMTKISRKIAPYLLASSISMPFACTTNNSRILPSAPQIQEYSPQEQEEAKQVKLWYEKASQDNAISQEEFNDLETMVRIPNTNVKQKAVYLTSLASETRPDGDVNHDTKENIFDLIYLLVKLGNNEDCDINKDGKTNIFDLITLLQVLGGYYDTYLVKGQHFDNDTEQGAKAVITIDGKEYYTDINGSFDVRAPKRDSLEITARQIDENGDFTGFKRTKKIPGRDIDTLKVYSVSYPTQEGVTPELFKRFCEIACFEPGSNGFGYWGMKTGLKNKDNVFWIASHNWWDNAKATREDQLYVKSIIENEIYPHLRPEYQFPIYLEDPDNPETIPWEQNGKIAIIPSNDGEGFSIAVVDNNKDGIADYSGVILPAGYLNETGKSGILQETFSSLTSVNEVAPGYGFDYGQWEGNKWKPYSALASIGDGLTDNPRLTESDNKLINIEHRYKPLESIENILGL